MTSFFSAARCAHHRSATAASRRCEQQRGPAAPATATADPSQQFRTFNCPGPSASAVAVLDDGGAMLLSRDGGQRSRGGQRGPTAAGAARADGRGGSEGGGWTGRWCGGGGGGARRLLPRSIQNFGFPCFFEFEFEFESRVDRRDRPRPRARSAKDAVEAQRRALSLDLCPSRALVGPSSGTSRSHHSSPGPRF